MMVDWWVMAAYLPEGLGLFITRTTTMMTTIRRRKAATMTVHHMVFKNPAVKKNAYVLFQCYAIMHIRSRKSAKYETILLRNHWITRETRTLCVDIYTVKAVVYERSLFHFYFEVVGFMGQPPIMQYYTTLHGINDYLRMNDHLHRIHRRIHSQMTRLYSRKSHADRSHLGESRTR